MTENLTTWVVLRRHRSYQTSETLLMVVMKAFVGTDPATVKAAAWGYADELTSRGDDEWLAGLPEYERRSTVVLFEPEPVTATEVIEERQAHDG